ncbi:unnamed protein product, partial [Scytosiphon promiscuus]
GEESTKSPPSYFRRSTNTEVLAAAAAARRRRRESKERAEAAGAAAAEDKGRESAGAADADSSRQILGPSMEVLGGTAREEEKGHFPGGVGNGRYLGEAGRYPTSMPPSLQMRFGPTALYDSPAASKSMSPLPLFKGTVDKAERLKRSAAAPVGGHDQEPQESSRGMIPRARLEAATRTPHGGYAVEEGESEAASAASAAAASAAAAAASSAAAASAASSASAAVADRRSQGSAASPDEETATHDKEEI